MGKLGKIVSTLYIVLGLYILNSALKIIPIPEVLNIIDKGALLTSSILLLLGSYFFSQYNKYH